MDICIYCVEPITGARMGDKGGMAHTWCFHRAHPFRPRHTFWEVLNASDQMQVRELVLAYMPAELQAEIVRRYNERGLEDWQRRCVEG
jgi:hypothetical protein